MGGTSTTSLGQGAKDAAASFDAFNTGETGAAFSAPDLSASGSMLDNSFADNALRTPVLDEAPGNAFGAVGDDELGLDFDPDFESALSAPVGDGMVNRPQDVYRVEAPLSRSGILNRPAGTTFGADTSRAIKQTQDATGAKADGLIYPGGQTEHRFGAAGVGPQAGFAGTPGKAGYTAPTSRQVEKMNPLDRQDAIDHAKTVDDAVRLMPKMDWSKVEQYRKSGPTLAAPTIQNMARRLKNNQAGQAGQIAVATQANKGKASDLRSAAFSTVRDTRGNITGHKNIFDATRQKPALPPDHAGDIRARLYPAPKTAAEEWARTQGAMTAADKIKRLESTRHALDLRQIESGRTPTDWVAYDRGDLHRADDTGTYMPVKHPDRTTLAEDIAALKAMDDPALVGDSRIPALRQQQLEKIQRQLNHPEHAFAVRNMAETGQDLDGNVLPIDRQTQILRQSLGMTDQAEAPYALSANANAADAGPAGRAPDAGQAVAAPQAESIDNEKEKLSRGLTTWPGRYDFMDAATDPDNQKAPEEMQTWAKKVYQDDPDLYRQDGWEMDIHNPQVYDEVKKGLAIKDPQARRQYFIDNFDSFHKVEPSPAEKMVVRTGEAMSLGGAGQVTANTAKKAATTFPVKKTSGGAEVPEILGVRTTGHTDGKGRPEIAKGRRVIDKLSHEQRRNLPDGDGFQAGRKFYKTGDLKVDAGDADPQMIRTSQNNINEKFRKDKGGSQPTIEETTAKMKKQGRWPDDIPPIEVVERNGHVYTLDHRRLVAARRAGITTRYQKVKYDSLSGEKRRRIDSAITHNDNGAYIVNESFGVRE